MDTLISLFQAFALLILLIFVIWWGYRHLFQPARQQRHLAAWLDSAEKNAAFSLIETLYRGNPAKALAAQFRRQQTGVAEQWVYGEIEFIAFGQLLAQMNPQAGNVFVDCGSGAGKAVLTAALLYPELHCIGLELMPALHNLSAQQFQRFDQALQAQPCLPYRYNIELLHQDMLEYDYQNADIIFINATCFSRQLIQQLSSRLEASKAGSKVIITSQMLPSPQFQLQQQTEILMSWGMCRVFVYRRL